MRIKNVLHIASWYPAQNDPYLGVFIQRHISTVSSLTRSIIICFETRPVHDVVLETEAPDGLKIFRIVSPPLAGSGWYRKIRNIFRRVYTFNLAIKEVIRHLGKIDVVHIHVLKPAAWFALINTYLRSKPWVVTEHWTGYLPEDGSFKGIINKWITSVVVSKAAMVTTVSWHLKKAMEKHHLNTTYARVSNVVDTQIFDVLPDSEPKPYDFIHVSSLEERQKNVKQIISSLAALKEKGKLFSLLIVGPEKLHKELIQFAKNKNVESQIVWLPGQKAEELSYWMNRSRALLMFSNYENQPVVILEALCCGLPVISSKVGGIAELIAEDNGILVTSGNCEELAAAILQWEATKNQYYSLSIRNKATQICSPEIIAKQFISIYEEVSNA